MLFEKNRSFLKIIKNIIINNKGINYFCLSKEANKLIQAMNAFDAI